MIVGKSTTPPVPAPSSRTRNIPPALDAVVERCTKPKPADRYASAEDLARDLYTIAGLPMPVIPSAKASASGMSPIGARELIDLYAPAILESNVVPQAHDERRFNHLAGTIPLMRASDAQIAAPPVIQEAAPKATSPAQTIPMSVFQGKQPDVSDVDATLLMQPKNALASIPRPPPLNQAPADAAVRTQYLPPDAPIASPLLDLNEMHQALAEHRRSSISIPRPDFADLPDLADLNASGGTQMLMPADVSKPKRSEPSTTTSAVMSQSMPGVGRGTVPSDAGNTTGRRRRQNRGLLPLIGGAVVGAVVLLIVMVVMQSKPPVPPVPAGTSTSTALPKPPISSDALVNVPAPDTSATAAESPTAPQDAQPDVSAAPTVGGAPAPPTSAATTPTPPIVPTVKSLPTPTTTTTPSKTPSKTPFTNPKPAPKCTGSGVWKRCK
jgi:hypothetical protein